MKRLATCLALVSLPACTGSEAPPADDLGYAGTGIAVTIAPLDLPGITDACYSFEVTNEGGQRVVARGGPVATDDAPVAGQGGDGGPAGLSGTLANPLCSTRFGNSQGALSYVAPCDASPGSEQHTVTLWVNSVCQDGAGASLFDPTTNPDGCEPLSGFVNPCGATGCAVTAQCVENSDTPVSINFTIMASAQQGFFDIGVNFDNIFCSAKVDCVDGEGEPLELLHHPESGRRGQTAVLGLACSAGPGAEDTVILRDPITITCGEEVWLLDPAQPEGVVYTHEDGDNPAPAGSPVWQYAVYAGQEALPCGAASCNKTYWNVAIGFDPEADGCRVTTSATAGPASTLADLSTPEASTWPLIEVDLDLTESDGGLACSRHPLNSEPPGVSTSYTSLATPQTFTFGFDGINFTLPGVTCSFSGDPTCGWQNVLGTHALHAGSAPTGLRTQTHGLIGTRSFSAALLLKDGSPIDSTGDFYFEGEVTAQTIGIGAGNGSVGFVYRYQDAQNFYFVAIQPEFTGGGVIIIGWQNGVLFQPLRVAPSVSLAVTYALGIEVIGATHRVYVDGVLRGTWTDPQDRFTTGPIGVGTLHQAIATFDNLSFEPF